MNRAERRAQKRHRHEWAIKEYGYGVVCTICGARADAEEAQRCHCGDPVAYGFDGDPTHHRGMCNRCDEVRCDAYPGECGREARGWRDALTQAAAIIERGRLSSPVTQWDQGYDQAEADAVQWLLDRASLPVARADAEESS